MRRMSSTRWGGAGVLVLGLLVVAGCQGEDAGSAASEPAVVTPAPMPDEAAETTEGPATTEAAAQTTAAQEEATTQAPAETTEAAATTEVGTGAEETGEGEETEGAEGDAEDTGEAEAGDVIVVQEGAVFTTPAQAAFCSLSAPAGGMPAVISCEVAQSSVPPGEELMGICPSDGYGWYLNFFEDSGHGGFFCNHHDGIVHAPGIDLATDPWVDQGSVHVLPSGTRVPILDYGRVLRAGGMSCSVQPDGLTCNNPGTGHGFTLNTGSYVSW